MVSLHRFNPRSHAGVGTLLSLLAIIMLFMVSTAEAQEITNKARKKELLAKARLAFHDMQQLRVTNVGGRLQSAWLNRQFDSLAALAPASVPPAERPYFRYKIFDAENGGRALAMPGPYTHFADTATDRVMEKKLVTFNRYSRMVFGLCALFDEITLPGERQTFRLMREAAGYTVIFTRSGGQVTTRFDDHLQILSVATASDGVDIAMTPTFTQHGDTRQLDSVGTTFTSGETFTSVAFRVAYDNVQGHTIPARMDVNVKGLLVTDGIDELNDTMTLTEHMVGP